MPDRAVHANAYNRPQPREGPKVPYNNDSGSNPVLRGYALAAVSTMYGVGRKIWSSDSSADMTKAWLPPLTSNASSGH